MNNYYIAIRNDGLTGHGLINDPWDGSIVNHFDYVMSGIPTGSNIFIDTGVYPTRGQLYSGNWYIKSNWNISGSGIDKTIIKLVNVVSGSMDKNIALSSITEPVYGLSWSDNTILQNFTIDCNLNGQTDHTGINCGGVYLVGNNVIAQNLKVINWGTKQNGSEAFALSLIGLYTGAKILNCIVCSGATGSIDGATLLSVGPASQSFNDNNSTVNNLISGCISDGSGYSLPSSFIISSPTYTQGMSVYGKSSTGCNNYISNCSSACYQDSWRNQDITINNNIFQNVEYGIFMNLQGSGAAQVSLGTGNFLNNVINLVGNNLPPNSISVAIWIRGASSAPYSMDKMLISGNIIGFTNQTYAPNIFQYPVNAVQLDCVKSGIIINNTMNNFYAPGDIRFPVSGIFFTGKNCQFIILTGNTITFSINSGVNIL